MGFNTTERAAYGTFDSYPVLPSGNIKVPIAGRRTDLDYHRISGSIVARNNIPLGYAFPNFFGFPEFPEGTEGVSDLYALPNGAIRTIRQPAPYFPEAVLVVGTDVPVPRNVNELKKMANDPMPTAFTHELFEDVKIVYNAHRLGALRVAIDTAAGRKREKATAVAISHQSPITTKEQPYPRSGPPTHDTIGVIRHKDLIPGINEHPRLVVERALLIPQVDLLAEQMQGALADLGIKSVNILAVPRVEKPTGVGFHIFDLSRENLVSPEGIRDATTVFDAITLAHEEVYPQVFGNLPDEIEHQGNTFTVLKTPGQNQILHMHDNYLVYGYRPFVTETHLGGAEGSDLSLDRSVDYIPTVQQQRRIEVFNRKVRHTVHASTRRLGYERYRRWN